MVKKLKQNAAIALARKYGFDLQLILAIGAKTHGQWTGTHDLLMYPILYGRANSYAVSIIAINGATVERFNFTEEKK